MASCSMVQPLLAGCRATAPPRGRRCGMAVRASAAPVEARKRPEYVPNRIDDPDYVRIFDTTLRDGEQSPGATLTSKEKLEIAKQLSKLGKRRRGGAMAGHAGSGGSGGGLCRLPPLPPVTSSPVCPLLACCCMGRGMPVLVAASTLLPASPASPAGCRHWHQRTLACSPARPPSCPGPPSPPPNTTAGNRPPLKHPPPSPPSPAGVDIIEAGFPIASPDDFAAVRAIAMDVGNAVHADGYVPVICGLSRTRDKDLETAWEAVRHAKLPRVHTFIATSGGLRKKRRRVE